MRALRRRKSQKSKMFTPPENGTVTADKEPAVEAAMAARGPAALGKHTGATLTVTSN